METREAEATLEIDLHVAVTVTLKGGETLETDLQSAVMGTLGTEETLAIGEAPF